MKIIFETRKNISITIIEKKYITCKIFCLLVYIFAVWVSDAENQSASLEDV